MSDLRDLLRARFGGLPTAFWALAFGMLLNRSGAFLQPLLTYYLTGPLGMSLAEAARVVSVWGVGAVLGALIGGALTDRLGRKRTILMSSVGATAALLAFGQARTGLAIGALAFLLAALQDLQRPAVFAMVADVVPPVDRARAYALLYVAVNLAFSMAPVVGGQLARIGYDVLIHVSAGILVAYTLFVAVALRETKPEARDDDAPSAGFRTALADGVYVRFLGLVTVSALLAFQGMVPLAAWMKSQGHDAAAYGQVLALNGVLIVLIQPWIADRVGRLDPARAYATAILLQGVGFAMHGLGSTLAWHATALCVWTAGEILATPINSAVVAELAPAHARGRYQGMMVMSWALAGGTAPIVGALVMSNLRGEVLWAGCLAVGLLGAGGMLALGPSLRTRIREARSAGAVPGLSSG